MMGNMNKRTASACIMAVLTCMVSAQNPISISAEKDSVTQIIKSYTDSLALYKHQIDSLYEASRRQQSVRPVDERMLRLFMPLSFYNDVANRRFSLDSNSLDTYDYYNSSIDESLLNVYLYRPGLVAGIHKDEGRNITVAPETAIPATTQPNISEKTAMPDEAYVEKVPVMVRKPNFWKFTGSFKVTLTQNTFSSNWYQGGENNFNILNDHVLTLNYNNKQKVKWNNTLEIKLGLQTSKADTLHTLKTYNDLLRYTSNLSLQAIKKWDYSFTLIATTQNLKGYRSNDPVVYSDILSPLTVKLSAGMKYNLSMFKKKMNGLIDVAPLTYNWKYCGRKALVTRYGIAEGHHTMKDYGSSIRIETTTIFNPNISWKMRLYGYTTYKRAEVEIENTFNFKIGRYLTSTFYVYPRFDDNRKRDDHHGYWQFKEYMSFGLSYSL